MKKFADRTTTQQLNNSKTKCFYASLLVFATVVNVLVYFQFTETYASRKSATINSFPENIELKNGDVVLRDGKGLLSSVFRNSSLQQPKFTHAGFLRKINSTWYVYHFIDDVKKSGLHIEPISHFIDNDVCSAYALFRYAIKPSAQKRLDSLIIASQKQSIPFDSDFNLDNDSALYCTEYIARTLDKATAQNDFIAPTKVGIYTYIAPDNLYLNTHCYLVYQNEY